MTVRTISLRSKDADQEMQVERIERGHRLSLTCVCVDTINSHVYTGSKDGSLIKWCLKTKKIMHKVKSITKDEADKNESKAQRHHTRHINAIALSSDNKFLATGGWDKLIRIWSPQDLSHMHTFKLHRSEVTALVFRKSHPTLYSGSADRSVIIWTLEDDDNRCMVEALYGHESAVTSLDSLERERILSAGSRDQSIRVWKIVEQAQSVFETSQQSVDVVKYIDNSTFVSGGEDGSLKLWTTMKRTPLYVVDNAHGVDKYQKGQNGTTNAPSNQLKYWITSLATRVCHQNVSKSKGRVVKKRKLGDDSDEYDTADEALPTSHDDDDHRDHSEDGSDSDQAGAGDGAFALVASGSCDSFVRIWKVNKSGSKFTMTLHQSIECPGFVNDLCFTKAGDKLVAACGQEHKSGRWWKIRGPMNRLRILELNKT